MPAGRYVLFCLLGISVWIGVGLLPAEAQTQGPENVGIGRMDASGALSEPSQNPMSAAGGYGVVEPRLNANGAPAMAPMTGPQDSGTSAFGDRNPYVGLPVGTGDCWTWQLLPEGLLYKSYLAGPKEPRMGTEWSYTKGHGWFWDATLGGRVGLLRYGTDDNFWPEGWQWDFEGAASPRIDLESDRDLTSVDFRAGTVLTHRQGPWEWKFGYYHLSSHLGDEFMVRNDTLDRLNYVRDCLLYGFALRPHPDWRLYSEVGYAFNTDGGARPWEFQFGAEYSPAAPSSILGAPFAAGNCHLRQDNDFSGNFTLEAGWQWRGQGGRLARVGGYYFNGMSEQYQFFNQFEEQVGIGLWYDF